MSEKYVMPFEGQPFFRENRPGAGKREKALVAYIQEQGSLRDGTPLWTAFIQHVDGWDRIDNTSVIGKESWRPVPFEELETRYGDGYRALRLQLENLAAEVQGLRDRLAVLDSVTPEPEKVAAPVAPTRKVRDVPAAAG